MIKSSICASTRVNFTSYLLFVFLKELIKDLQTAKRQTWEERERLSERFDEERRVNLANKVLTNDGL